jgi:hypothetical protein
LGGKGGMNAWYQGDPVQFSRNVGNAIAGAAGELSKLFSDLMSDPIAALTKLANGAPGIAMKLIGRGRAPDIVAFKALLTGEPIGEWHMVVGNPYDPIAAIGNLICTEAKFQFNDIIGADNFPTELKVSITVEHGRPRDAGDIQSFFNRGQGRIYYPPKDTVDYLNNTSSQKNSMNDTSWGKGRYGDSNQDENTADKYSRSTKTFGLFSGSPTEFDNIIGQVNEIDVKGKEARIAADKMFLRTGAYQKGGK